MKISSKGLKALKYESLGKGGLALLVLALQMLYVVVAYQGTGFLVNYNDPEQFNSLELIFLVIFPLLLFMVGNWSVTSLMEGKGTFREIFLFTCYALTPMVLLNWAGLAYSRFIILEEAVLYYALLALGAGWTGLLLFMGILVIHEYTVIKGFATVALTILAMGVCIFVLLLLFSLFQQIYGFFFGIFKEISLRFF